MPTYAGVRWDGAGSFSEGLARVKKNGQWGFINKVGELVSQCQWDWAWDFSEGFAMVKKNGKLGFVNKSGELVIPCEWNEVRYFSEGFAAVRKEERWEWGFINKCGELVSQCQWDDARSFRGGLAAVRKEESWSFINKSGELIIQYRRRWGFINTSGELVIPCQWGDVENFNEGLAYVEKNGQWGKINTVGQLVIPPLFNQDFNKIELFGKERNYKWEGDGLTITINNKFKLIFNSKNGLCWLTNSNEEEIILEADTFETNLGLMEFLEIE